MNEAQATASPALGPTPPVHAVFDSPVGPLTVVAAGGAVTALLFEGHRHPLPPDRVGEAGSADVLRSAERQLAAYFDGALTAFDLPLAPAGNPFQQRVWALLRQIPFGETRTYGGLARQLGDPGLARAVGAANGRNPISIIVPCHRVIGADGKLVGYGGGVAHKQYLLGLEAGVTGTPGLF